MPGTRTSCGFSDPACSDALDLRDDDAAIVARGKRLVEPPR
jgi:hypothetical protein